MLLIDSTSLDAVLEEVRAAIAADEGDAFTFENLPVVLQDIRAAMKADRMMAGPEDLELANAVEKMLPEITARISEQHEELRAHLQADASWALTPLDMELDLLGPLAKSHHEPTHTRVLSYLLNPSGAHGLGVRVARELFFLIGKMIPGEDVFEKLSVDTPANTDLLRQVDVRAEQTVTTAQGEFRCDVWLELSDHERTVVVVIENKVGAGEHGGQLRAYEDAVWDYARRRRKLNFDAKLIYSSAIKAHGIGKYRYDRRSQRRTVRDTWDMEGRIFRKHERSASTHWHLALGCLKDKGPALTFVITPQDPGAPEALDKFAALLATEMNLDSANARDCFGNEGIFDCGVVAAAVPLQPTAKHSEVAASLAKQLNEFFARHGDKLEQALNACAG